MSFFKGLTWDHPRGYKPLQAWAQLDDLVNVQWDIQKLEGFESHPIDELAEKYDILIVDNPGIGEAVEKNCLLPLESFLSLEQLDFLKKNSIGNSYESYRYGGQHWAIPIDAASQVCALAGDIAKTPPITWDDVILLSKKSNQRIVLSLGGPHALLTFYSICLSFGDLLFKDNRLIIKQEIAIHALSIMQNIYQQQDKSLIDLNPIGLLDAMAKGKIDICPAIFGYINYADPSHSLPITFCDIPHAGQSILRGSILGGTGLALSSRCTPTPELIQHIMGYVSESVQKNLVVDNGGQPANIAAWRDEYTNKQTGNFLSSTFNTVSSAYVRPKYQGYIHRQDAGSKVIREGLKLGSHPEVIFAKIEQVFSL